MHFNKNSHNLVNARVSISVIFLFENYFTNFQKEI